MYNLTNIMGTGNETGLLDFVVGVNNVLMYQWLGDIFLIGLGCIFFIAFYASTQDIPKTMMSTFMIIFILSISTVALGLSHTMTPFVALTFLVIGVVLSYTSNRG